MTQNGKANQQCLLLARRYLGHRWRREWDYDDHQQFLNDGGLGLIIGDGKLPHPGPEEIIETYYSLQLAKDYWWVSPDYQFVIDPGYNRDRGPVSVIGARLHGEF